MTYISTPQAAELNARDLMMSWGYSDAVATTGGADGGIDVRSSRALAQVKWKGGVTGRPDVQKLVGARATGSQQLFFFSAAGYSKQAVDYADEVGVALFIYDPTGAATAANPTAKLVLERATTPTTGDEVVDWVFIGVLGAAALIVGSLAVWLWQW